MMNGYGASGGYERGSRRRAAGIRSVVVLVAALICVGVGGLALGLSAYSRHYAGRIYPGASVYGVDLGGLNVDEAATTLKSGLPDPATLPITLRDRERTWYRTWADVALRPDPLETARLAYQVGRQGTRTQQVATQMRALFTGMPLSPVILLPDSGQAAEALRALAPDVVIPPVDAMLIIQPEGVIPVPGRQGRELDIEATVAALPHALEMGDAGLAMDILTRPTEPAIGDPNPAQAQAETLLTHPFTLVADDPLTDFNTTWTVAPDVVAGWLIAQPVLPTEDGDDARLGLTVQANAARAYLADLNSQLTGEVTLDVEGTLAAVRAAVESGESESTVRLAHRPRAYTVQPGDTLTSVARAHGFPVWHLAQANPDIEPGELRPGQQMTIPSVDVLFPLPLITERRIVVDISDQRLTAYDGETPVYDLVCSTGIASSPTLTGTFQVLGKEENAYASNWDLWMPHFMGIYRTGPDFTNGIHALPTLSNGVRLWEGYLGHPVSYGCIVIGLDEAAVLYEWTELGTLVMIQE
jgi:lipoprotein-anchoring transpeptidase ErfK/SrfK